MPIGLTTHQLGLITQAAKSVAIDQRDDFLRAIAKRLGSAPSDIAVTTAIDTQLQLALGKLPVFLCDAFPKGANK